VARVKTLLLRELATSSNLLGDGMAGARGFTTTVTVVQEAVLLMFALVYLPCLHEFSLRAVEAALVIAATFLPKDPETEAWVEVSLADLSRLCVLPGAARNTEAVPDQLILTLGMEITMVRSAEAELLDLEEMLVTALLEAAAAVTMAAAPVLGVRVQVGLALRIQPSHFQYPFRA